MKDEKILTLHPQGKAGVNISLNKYEQVKHYIIKTLNENGEITFEKLTSLAVNELAPVFEGKILWYLVTVKLDLEARAIIERIPKTSPHRLRLKK